MKTLYFVALYSHQRNEWARVLCSAASEEAAREECESAYAEGDQPWQRTWKTRLVRVVCSTPDEVWTEV